MGKFLKLKTIDTKGNYLVVLHAKGFGKQVYLHQILYYKLLKFAHDNKCKDAAEWDGLHQHWTIRYDTDYKMFVTHLQRIYKAQEVYFSSVFAARAAIKDVVEPFMKKYTDFVW